MHPPASDSPRPSSVGSAHSSQSSGNRHTGQHDICVGEELKIAVDIALERFRLSEEQKVLEYPSSLTSTERAYVHRLCQSLGLKSKSRGKGGNRFLTVTKKDGTQNTQMASVLHLVKNSRHQVSSLLQRYPLTNRERQDLQPRTERSQYNEGLARDLNKTTTGRLNNGVPQVPPARLPSELNAFRSTLPCVSVTSEIMKLINENRVVLISGETGCGKTTQVPQMILDDAHNQNKLCRILCTQPRRLAALSVAERVAAERGEKIGQTVGFQIRLESRVSPKTLLTYCTNGVLLRTLMGGDSGVSTVTHIIVDEVHERDRFSDFLLIALRDLMPRYRALKLVLMSATINTQLFSNYFSGCPIIHVPGTLFDVEELFLEDILKWTSYTSQEMDKYRSGMGKMAGRQEELKMWCQEKVTGDADAPTEETDDSGAAATAGSETDEGISEFESEKLEAVEEKEEPESWLVEEMDNLLSTVWHTGNADIFAQIFHLIISENLSVDYHHSTTSATPLMIASGRGFFNVVEQLLNLGANIQARASNDWSALDWARHFKQAEVLELLEAHMAVSEETQHDDSVLLKESKQLSEEDRQLLSIYHNSFDDERVDIDLILCLLIKIHCTSPDGAILVFLPGYDDIVTLRDRILEDKRLNDSNRYIIYTLHSSMQSADQKKIFRTPPPGVRKIILSTNIAETSITINDVVYVLDSGKVKEKSYDALTSVSMLKSHWVSKASSQQRRGRAGRCQPGICYHLFSNVRFESFQEFQEPEILRHPLQELCLHTKLLAPANTSIADFLAKAPEPPAFLLTRNAVHLLKQIDSLDTYEDLTELGHHLADLPVEPQYGKMILYSVVLKCLDPVLTIACALAYRDPFLLPKQASLKRAAAMSRRKFTANTYSDHMALLRAFQAWQKARMEGWEKSFCQKNYLSSATMEMIVGMRAQLLGQLRASGFVRARGNGDIRDLNTNSENWAVVKGALVAGMYPNVLRVNRQTLQLNTMKETRVRFHNSSVLSAPPNMVGTAVHKKNIAKLPTDWLLYEEMTRAHRLAQVKCCTLVNPATISIFAGPAKLPMDLVREAESGPHGAQGEGFLADTSDSEGDDKDEGPRANFRLDDWLHFRMDSEAALMLMQLRQKWHSLFLRRMRAPSKPWSQLDESVIRAVVGVLTNEEQSLGLQQPAGIGQRPKPMASESVVSSGGSRRGSYDTEYSDDSSNSEHNRQTPTRSSRPFKFQSTPPRKKTSRVAARYVEDKSETSSQRSSSSAAGSNPNSGSNSLRGSAGSSPCESPQPAATAYQLLDSDNGTSTTTYYVMKSNSHKSLDLSQQKGTWATTITNEKRLNKAYKDGKTVYLVFSVQGSGHFQGYAKMTSEVTGEKNRDYNAPALGNTFCVDWIRRANLPFQMCHHLSNPWNEHRKVQISRDGQEIEPNVGEQLLKLWDKPSGGSARSPQYSGRGAGHYSQGGSHSADMVGGGDGGYRQSQRQSPRGMGGGPQGGRGSGHMSQRQWQGHHVPYNQMSGQHYNPMYPTAVRGQGQMMASPRGHQSVSPVMILQRGTSPGSMQQSGYGGGGGPGSYQHKSQK